MKWNGWAERSVLFCLFKHLIVIWVQKKKRSVVCFMRREREREEDPLCFYDCPWRERVVLAMAHIFFSLGKEAIESISKMFFSVFLSAFLPRKKCWLVLRGRQASSLQRLHRQSKHVTWTPFFKRIQMRGMNGERKRNERWMGGTRTKSTLTLPLLFFFHPTKNRCWFSL